MHSSVKTIKSTKTALNDITIKRQCVHGLTHDGLALYFLLFLTEVEV